MEEKILLISSELRNVAGVENFLEEIIVDFDVKEEYRAKITLAVVEAVNNSILYGNKLNPDKKVKLTAAKKDNVLSVSVEDEGEGFNYKNIPDPTTAENLMKAAGRGLYLMLTLTDELCFHENGRNVIMCFCINS